MSLNIVPTTIIPTKSPMSSPQLTKPPMPALTFGTREQKHMKNSIFYPALILSVFGIAHVIEIGGNWLQKVFSSHSSEAQTAPVNPDKGAHR